MFGVAVKIYNLRRLGFFVRAQPKWFFGRHRHVFNCLEGKTDEDMTKSKGKDPLEGLGGPMTRARARKAKEALQQVLSILFEYKPKFQGEKSKVVSCIMAQMEED